MHRGLPRRRFASCALAPVLVLLSLACSGGDGPTSPGGNDGGNGGGAPVSTPTTVKLGSTSFTLDRWGDTATVAATVLDQTGKAMSTSVSFASSDTSVATVSGNGRLSSWKAGTATITASAAGLQATAQVTVRVQGNGACRIPEAKEPGPVAPAYTFTTTEGEPGTTYWGGMSIPIDVDGDGDLDVLDLDSDPRDASTYTGVAVLLNQGDGTFARSADDWFGGEGSPFNGPRDYVKADIDGDGRMDLYVAQPGFDPGGVDGKDCGNVTCSGAPNALLLAQPGGGLRNVAATALVPNTLHGFTHTADMADVDCDGDPDLYEGTWPNENAPDPSSLKINTAGVLTEDNGRVTGAPITPVGGSAFCDVDADGDPDLILGPANGEPRLFVNDGFGRLRYVDRPVFPPSRSGPAENIYTDMSCGDLTGDGLPELVAHDHSFNGNFGRWVVLKNEGDLRFSDWNEVLPQPDAAYFFVCGGGPAMMYDFNGDGWMDLYNGGSMEHPMAVFFNTGGNGFTPVAVPGFGGGDAFGMCPAVADYDGDGRLDIFMEGGHGYNTLVALSR